LSLYKLFKTDPRCETEGVTLDYGDGVKIRIARAGGSNKNYIKAMDRLGRKYHRELGLDILPEETATRLYQELYADSVILGWEGVSDEAGNLLPFSREAVLKVFADLPDLWNDVRAQAQSIELFRADLTEREAKN